jgi:lambda repressor-like predicted transcriptional regulator
VASERKSRVLKLLDGRPMMTLRQNTKVQTRTNEERRRAELASSTLHHVLQRNWRHAFTCVAHFII